MGMNGGFDHVVVDGHHVTNRLADGVCKAGIISATLAAGIHFCSAKGDPIAVVAHAPIPATDAGTVIF